MPVCHGGIMTRVAADIIPAIKDWLDVQSIGADVTLIVPTGWKPASGPMLLVADDGGPVLWPIKSQHTIRLTGYAAGRTQARQVVTLAAGKLAQSYPHVGPGMGAVLDARDPATGAVLASALVTVHARTVEV